MQIWREYDWMILSPAGHSGGGPLGRQGGSAQPPPGAEPRRVQVPQLCQRGVRGGGVHDAQGLSRLAHPGEAQA